MPSLSTQEFFNRTLAKGGLAVGNLLPLSPTTYELVVAHERAIYYIPPNATEISLKPVTDVSGPIEIILVKRDGSDLNIDLKWTISVSVNGEANSSKSLDGFKTATLTYLNNNGWVVSVSADPTIDTDVVALTSAFGIEGVTIDTLSESGVSSDTILRDTKTNHCYKVVKSSDYDYRGARGLCVQLLVGSDGILHASALGLKKDTTSYDTHGDNAIDQSLIVQKVLDRAAKNGGGWVNLDVGEFYTAYPVFIGSNTTVEVGNTIIRSRAGVSSGCVFVGGDLREINREIVETKRGLGQFGSFQNANFVDVPLAVFPEIDDPVYGLNGSSSGRIRAQNILIIGGDLRASLSGDWSVTGVWYGNVANMEWRNGRGRYWVQHVSIGSDIEPRTPYALESGCVDFTNDSPHPSRIVYYTGGFISHAKRSYIRGVKSRVKPSNTTYGDGVYGNYCIDCEISDFDITLAKEITTQIGSGVGFQNSQGCRVFNGVIRNAKHCITDYYSDISSLSQSNPNTYTNIISVGCTNKINTSSKYTKFINITGTTPTGGADILCATNSQYNTFTGCDTEIIAVGSGAVLSSWLNTNKVNSPVFVGSENEARYFDFYHAINLKDLDKVQSISTNRVQLTNYVGTVKFKVPLSQHRAAVIINWRTYFTFGAGSQTANSSVKISLVKRGNFTGNSSAENIVIDTRTFTPSVNTVQDITGNATASFAHIMWPTAHDGFTASQDYHIDYWLEVEWLNPTASSSIKNGRILGKFI